MVYGRITGWGQDGPLAAEAGHDINYLALTGLLHGLGEPDRPPRPPMNLVADYAGGGMMLAFGMVAALLDVQRGAEGRVVDAAMSDGAALTGALIYGLKAAGAWSGGRGGNLLDGGEPLYGCYQCADGKYLALGAIEPQFVAALLQRVGIAGHGGEIRCCAGRGGAQPGRMGGVVSPGKTPASRQCSTWTRRPRIRTMSHGGHSPRSAE